MPNHVTGRPVEEVPPTATVTDYDELSDEHQETIRRLSAGETVTECELHDVVVRFTDYLRVESLTASAAD